MEDTEKLIEEPISRQSLKIEVVTDNIIEDETEGLKKLQINIDSI